ncbi:MAG: hypothetical protein ABIF88_00090 [archaeon]
MKNKLAILFLISIFLPQLASAFLISDQGTNVMEVATGNLTTLANLTISIYDDSTGGNLIFEQNFSDIIANGSWNVMINPNLEYGKSYWKDYKINGEDLNFDGNERLEFQSSIGKMNNISFINFSLINSCSAGSSIRLIYENGSVECETDDNLGTPNLTDYALKNQSETFTGDITTSQTGFFGWLGSLTSRIAKLFVQDIDFNGTINGSGNIDTTGNISADYFMGNGSLLTNLPAGTESDPIFIAENTTLWNAINSKLAETDQRYNETNLVLSINTTSNIMGLDFYNKSEIGNLISGVGGGNSSFNQSLTDTLYASIVWGYNQTSPAISWVQSQNYLTSIADNSTKIAYQNISNIPTCGANEHLDFDGTTLSCTTDTGETDSWAGNYTNYYNKTEIDSFNESWTSTYNATYDAKVSDNESWNESYADGLYADISVTGDNASWNESYADGLYADISVTGDNSSFNQSLTDTLYADVSVTGDNASWNESLAHTLFDSTYNATYDAKVSDNESWNESYADTLYADISVTGGNLSFNQTYTDLLYSEILWNYNQSLATYNMWNDVWLSTYNATYDAKVSDNESWNESYADGLYADISVTGGNESWNQSLADSLYADVSVTGGNASWNESYADGLYIAQSDEENLNVNSSDYWDDMDSINTTQMEDNEGVLNILESWFSSMFDSLFGGKTTDDLTEGTSNFYDNKSFNESYADGLYADISVTGGNASWNESLAHTLFDSTYNATYDAKVSDNESWNQSFADSLYADISVTGDNESWNESYADESYISQSEEVNLDVNSSRYWGVLGNANMTQMENNNGVLNIAISWFSSMFDSLFGGKTTDDLTEGSTNLYDNESWNESYADELYAGIEWDYNQTIPADSYTDTKVGTSDLHAHDASNITSPIWVNKTGDKMSGNLNMSSKNITTVNCILFSSGGKICSA